MMRKFLQKKWVLVMIFLVLTFVGIQFIRTGVDNPPVTSDIAVPASVKKIFTDACYDCHSNETKLSWFDKIVPAEWLVAKHVMEGRAAVNFSGWGNLSAANQSATLFESLNLIQHKIMPLQQYQLLHPAAKVDETEIDSIKSFLKTLFVKEIIDTAKNRKWNDQYLKWIREAGSHKIVKPAPNGIAFMPEYKNWVAISSTERVDKGTLRVIVGNEIAVKAIKKNHINPWPDGSTFAKIIWVQTLDSAGDIHAGEFIQVDFMMKGREKYAATDGWGYSRWIKGIQLEPYGNNSFFTTECANCHRSMKDNDYVFTTPVNLSADPGMEDKVLNSWVNKETGTMTTLYGNDIAASFVRTHTGEDYPAGSILTMVTWFQKEDEHWFGGNIPGNIKLIEKVRFSNTDGMNTIPSYERYEGNPLKKVLDFNKKGAEQRLSFILTQRANVMP